MSEYPEIAARFARDTADHEMTVLHEDGSFRHLRFARPGGLYAFDLLTWDHRLVITGGVHFMFSLYPTVDLFDMFRRTALVGDINPGYWQEKVVAGRDGVECFSDELLRREINDTVKTWTEDLPDEKAEALRAAVEEHFFGEWTEFNVEYESEAHRALHEFDHDGHQFYDWHEWRMRDFSHSFLWACHAIRWGIAQYDAAKATPKAVA